MRNGKVWYEELTLRILLSRVKFGNLKIYEDCTTSGKARSFHFCNSLVQDQTGQRLFSCFQISFSFLQNPGFPIKSNQIVFQRNAKLNPLREGPINIILFFKTQSYEILYIKYHLHRHQHRYRGCLHRSAWLKVGQEVLEVI